MVSLCHHFNIKSTLSAIPTVHHPQQSDAVLIIYIVHGLFVIIVITSFVIFNSKSTLSAIPLYITTESNYVTAILIYCAWSLCHHNGDN